MDEKIVLLVEDNDDDVELTLRSFKSQKIFNTVVVARNGQEAIDYLFATGSYARRDTNELPIVILLDLKLPVVDGMDVLRQIRSNELTKRIPVVILTTSSEDKDKINTYGLGANSYVRKPVNFDEFLEATRQLGLYWLLLNETAPVPILGSSAMPSMTEA
jgi:two-component system response regulator